VSVKCLALPIQIPAARVRVVDTNELRKRNCAHRAQNTQTPQIDMFVFVPVDRARRIGSFDDADQVDALHLAPIPTFM